MHRSIENMSIATIPLTHASHLYLCCLGLRACGLKSDPH